MIAKPPHANSLQAEFRKISEAWEKRILAHRQCEKDLLLIEALWLASGWFDLMGFKHLEQTGRCSCKCCRRALKILRAAEVKVIGKNDITA